MSARRAAEILSHYFRTAFEGQGLEWTPENTRDIVQAVRDLVASDTPRTVPTFEAREARPEKPSPRRPATGYETVNIREDRHGRA